MTNQELITHVRKLCEAATPGPYIVKLPQKLPSWFTDGMTKEQLDGLPPRKAQVVDSDGETLCCGDGFSVANATLIAAAPTLLLQLAEALENADGMISDMSEDA